MCRICGKYNCPPACPSYNGESAELGERIDFCAVCGTPLYQYEYIKYSYGKPYCVDCVDMIFEEDG